MSIGTPVMIIDAINNGVFLYLSLYTNFIIADFIVLFNELQLETTCRGDYYIIYDEN